MLITSILSVILKFTSKYLTYYSHLQTLIWSLHWLSTIDSEIKVACCTWSHGLRRKKSFKTVCRCHQLLSGFLAKGHLPRVAGQSHRSLMIRVIMKWSRRLCTDLLALKKTWAKRPFDEGAVRSVITLNGVLNLQMRSVGSHSTSRKVKGGKYRQGYN
jgi:hypothetical protein